MGFCFVEVFCVAVSKAISVQTFSEVVGFSLRKIEAADASKNALTDAKQAKPSGLSFTFCYAE